MRIVRRRDEAARVIAIRAPTAIDLRVILSVMRMSANLERIGDLAKNLAKRTGVLVGMHEVGSTAASLRRMAREGYFEGEGAHGVLAEYAMSLGLLQPSELGGLAPAGSAGGLSGDESGARSAASKEARDSLASKALERRIAAHHAALASMGLAHGGGARGDASARSDESFSGSSYSGTTIDDDRLASILTALDIDVVERGNGQWRLNVPAYRSDVTRPADIAEEVLRIHGFDHVPLPERMTGTLEVPAKPNREDVLFGWRELLVGLGFTEIMSNSLTKASYAELVTDRDLQPEASVHMLNPLSADLGAMRQSLVFQGLEAIARNTNHQQPDLRLFEFGRTYTQHAKEEGGKRYDEQEHLSMWVTGRAQPVAWNQPKGKEARAVLFTLKHAVETLLERVGLTVLSDVEPSNEGLLVEGVVLRHRNGQEIGRWGMVQPEVAAACGVDAPVFWADFKVASLWKAVKKRRVKAHDLPKFPSVRRDLALVVDKGLPYETLRQAALGAEKKLLKEVTLFDVYQGKGLEGHEKSYAMAFKLQHPDATLNDKQIESAMGRILEALQKAGARLR